MSTANATLTITAISRIFAVPPCLLMRPGQWSRIRRMRTAYHRKHS